VSVQEILKRVKLTKKIQNHKKEFVNACRKIGRYDLARYSSGNLSSRIDENRVLASASKSWLAELETDQVSLCQLQTGKLIEGPKPTIESRFHLGILRNREDINVVLHFQSPYAAAVACTDNPLDYNFNVIIEVPLYIGTPGLVPYSPPGSKELADSVIQSGCEHDMVIMKNHGLVTVGRDYDDAIQKAGFFELACQVLLTVGDNAGLDCEQVKKLRRMGSG
jgi:ribulose-5-phosphate 4-epimerase/fuculose-1-phosphate aldolase